MSEPQLPATPPLPGPPPPLPDLAAVSASIDQPEAPPAPAVAATPSLVRPTSDVADVPAASRMPGSHVLDYGRLPTAPVATTEYGPHEGETSEWEPVAATRPRAILGAWALGLAIAALLASFSVGWMLPLGLIAIVVAIVAWRRPVEHRAVLVWALVLATLSILYSAGWLLWAAWTTGLLA